MPVDPTPINDPPHIASQHARMVECAILSGEEDKAIAAVRRAFRQLAELEINCVTYDDHICAVVTPRMVELLHAGDARVDRVACLDALSAVVRALWLLHGTRAHMVRRKH